MGYFDRDTLQAHEAPIAQSLFERMVDGGSDTLSENDRADMPEYLLRTWHKAAEAVMRPIQKRVELEAEIDRLRERLGEKGDLPF